jgi:hypothetical protein
VNNLEDVTERLKELLSAFWARVEENSTYNTLREKYETLSSSQQQLISIGAISASLLFLISIPVGTLLSSSTYTAEFEEKKTLIEGLLAADQNMKQRPPIPPGITSTDLQMSVRNSLQVFRLIESQGPQMEPLNNNPAGPLASPILEQNGLHVTLKGLNLQQTLDIGKSLDVLHPSVKMIGMDVQASTEFPKYYNVVYRLVSFAFPQANTPAPPPADAQKPPRPSGRSRARGGN